MQTVSTLRSSGCVLVLLFLISQISAQSAAGQQVVIRSADEGAVAMMPIPGGLLVVEGKDEARIARRIVPSATDETPDIQENDLIIYLDGERIASADKFRALYEKVAVGTEVKVGIQRGETKMIRSFVKPEMQNAYTSNEGGRVMRLEMDGPGGDELAGLENRGMWPAGFLVGEREGKVVIGASMPIPGKAEALERIEPGDAIVALNGAAVSSVEQLNSVYESITVGDDVTVEIERDGVLESLMFKKPEPPRMRIEMRNN